MKTIKGKMLSIYAMVFLALLATVIGAFVAVDTQRQHLVLTELLSKQKLLVERVTFSTINTGEIALANPERFNEKLSENTDAITEYSGAVDFMLQAFEDKEYPLDGRIVRLKFRDEFLVVFDDALNTSKLEWQEAKQTIDWLLRAENLQDIDKYQEELDHFEELNLQLIRNSDYLTKICRDEASRKRVQSNIIQISSISIAVLIFFFMMYMMQRDFKQPLDEIQTVFKDMGRGQFKRRLHRNREDEFKELFDGFNHLADSLSTIRDIESKILAEDSIYKIMTYVKESFKPFAAYDNMTIVYKSSANVISKLSITDDQLDEEHVDQLHTYTSIEKLSDNLIVVPISINDAYLGYAQLENKAGFDDSSLSFLETLSSTISFAFYKSLLFRDLLAIVTDGLADLAESRDPETRLHLIRMSSYAQIIANELKSNDKYKDLIDNDFMTNIKLTAPMHDIGKISVPDHILLKPGKLTDEEFEIMKTHAYEGSVVLRKIHDRFEQYNLDYFEMAAEIALCHQEKFDGRGYPNAISGQDIPLSARISALADVFDALTSKRPYKDAFSLEKSYKIILESKGSHFDPDVVDAFFSARETIEQVYSKYKET
ncbi:HD domain-containing protein [Acidaminobacter sp. JC074]|uniref:HD domain-containing phosphohydrolase n=1 Tax=Acidaminobacter sp. JC074 TaxID=2530199 RepID=UPI001F0FA236|nr:HD domain-containing phosphohydrolase [Acidaminobacter sp. JC074]MCH4888412.1 HD domain-containing protein [Acidaminobacter sp. JC074]